MTLNMLGGSGAIETRGRTPIILCADDYGIAPGVCKSILTLIENGRLSATSCMTGSRHWPAFASSLSELKDKVDVGLHLTLTDQEPIGVLPRLAPGGKFPSLGTLMKSAYLSHLSEHEVRDEIVRQFDAFESAMGCAPDYVDGHHHVHQLPVVRKALLEVAVKRLQGPGYIRICMDSIRRIVRRGSSSLRTLAIGCIGIGLKRQCEELGLRTNSSFAGVYDYGGRVAYGDVFTKFCNDQTPNGLIMCHPGFVDDDLKRADSLADQRTVEHDFLLSNEFLDTLDRAELVVSRFRY